MPWNLFYIASTFECIMISTMFFKNKAGIFEFYINSLRFNSIPPSYLI